jgi:hypothetical protein
MALERVPGSDLSQRLTSLYHQILRSTRFEGQFETTKKTRKSTARRAEGCVIHAGGGPILRRPARRRARPTQSAASALHDPTAPASEERERYYSESKLIAALFGIPRDCLPSDWTAFAAYNEGMWASDSLTVGPVAHEIAHRLLLGGGTWLCLRDGIGRSPRTRSPRACGRGSGFTTIVPSKALPKVRSPGCGPSIRRCRKGYVMWALIRKPRLGCLGGRGRIWPHR